MLFPKINSNTSHGHSQAKILTEAISQQKRSFTTLILIYFKKMHSPVTAIKKKFKLFTAVSALLGLISMA